MSALAFLQRSIQSSRDQSSLFLTRAAAPPSSVLVSDGDPGAMIGSVNQGRIAGQPFINPERYNKNWVYASIRVSAQRIAEQEVIVARRRKRARRSRAEVKALERITPKSFQADLDAVDILDSHPLLDSLRKPNPLMTCWHLLWVTIASLDLTGCCFYWITDDDRDGVRDIWFIPAHWLRPIYADKGKATHIAWKLIPENSAQSWDIPAEQIVYISYPNPCSLGRPLSPLQAAASPTVLDELILECQRKSFRSPHPSVAISVGRTPGTNGLNGPRYELKPEQKAQLYGAFQQMYSGSVNYDRPIILDGMLEKLDFLNIKNRDMDYPNAGQMTKQRITQNYFSNPISMGEIQGANRASAVAADENLVSTNLNPKITLLSQSFTRWLAPMFAAPDEELLVWVKPCVAIDRELDLQERTAAMDRGCLTVNEFRQQAGMPPISGKAGEALLVPTNYTLVDQDGKPIAPILPVSGTGASGGSGRQDTASTVDSPTDDKEAEAAIVKLAQDQREAIYDRLAHAWICRLLASGLEASRAILEKTVLAAATAELWASAGQWTVPAAALDAAKTWSETRAQPASLDQAAATREVAEAIAFGRSLIAA